MTGFNFLIFLFTIFSKKGKDSTSLFFDNNHHNQSQINERKKEKHLKKSTYKSYDELPLFLNAEMVGNVLGVSSTVCYEMMHAGKLPVLRIGSRLIVPKEKFLQWIEKNTSGGTS